MIGDILQPTHLLFILVIALLVLGPKRLPEAGRALGRGLRDFKGALSSDDDPPEMVRGHAPEAPQAYAPAAAQAYTPEATAAQTPEVTQPHTPDVVPAPTPEVVRTPAVDAEPVQAKVEGAQPARKPAEHIG